MKRGFRFQRLTVSLLTPIRVAVSVMVLQLAIYIAAACCWGVRSLVKEDEFSGAEVVLSMSKHRPV